VWRKPDRHVFPHNLDSLPEYPESRSRPEAAAFPSTLSQVEWVVEGFDRRNVQFDVIEMTVGKIYTCSKLLYTCTTTSSTRYLTFKQQSQGYMDSMYTFMIFNCPRLDRYVGSMTRLVGQRVKTHQSKPATASFMTFHTHHYSTYA
jgi:hypothetical protein